MTIAGSSLNESATGELSGAAGIADLFRRVVTRHPHVAALTTSTGTYTYADIDRWSDAIASQLIARRLPTDVPIAIVTRDNVALAPAAFGVIKAGHYFLTIDPSDPDDRVALLLRASSASLCVVDSMDDLPPSVARSPAVVIPPLPSTATAPPAAEVNRWVHVIFTSGTTGTPKAIRTLQSNLMARSLRGGAKTVGERRNWTAVPGYTRAATHVLNALVAGQTLCAFDARHESLDAFAAYIKRERIEHLALTPSYFRRLMALPPEDLDLSTVRSVGLNADKVTPADVEIFKSRFPRGTELHVSYVASETGFVCRMTITHDTPIPGPLAPMGTKVPTAEVWLLDDDGKEVEEGEAGELVVRGPDVAEEYWNDPVLTAQKFRSDPAHPGIRTFYTGDLALRDAAGLYYFAGRKDARLKIQGRRIDPLEIEAALIATGDVREAAVVGKAEGTGDLRLVAYVVARDPVAFDPRAVRARMRERHPDWMIPARIVVLDAIPMTRVMKVDRVALTERVDPAAFEDESPAPADDLEQQLIAIWSKAIGTKVRADDDFFDDHAGESIAAAQIIAAAQRGTGVTMHVSQLLELSSVRKMADYVRRERARR